MTDLFNTPLNKVDADIFEVIQKEQERQQHHIDLIASENLTSKAVMEAQGSVLTNKYAEGYPGRRYYGGCECVDDVEALAIERSKQLFQAEFSNVQPHSGSQANQAVFSALLSPGDKILGMDLASGGHLTHGHPMNLSGKWFEVCSYGVDKDTGLIDYDAVESIAKKEKPKLIIAGFSAYPRPLDYKRFRDIADQVGAFLMADMAHIAGLVATGLHENPLPYADFVTTTTHKTLRGPRGGLVLSNNKELFKKLNSSVFPGIQGGPLMHVIAGKAVAFKLALEDSFKDYMNQVVKNAQTFAHTLTQNSISLVTGGTDNHMLLLDLRALDITGNVAEKCLEQVGIITNKNTIPFDPQPPMITSGLRIGTPSITSRGFKEAETQKVATLFAQVLKDLAQTKELSNPQVNSFKKEVEKIVSPFPYYTN